MGGEAKISTQDAMIRVQQYLYLKLKMGTVSAATQQFIGLLKVSFWGILKRSYLICLANAIF
jgi:hypothetical protein